MPWSAQRRSRPACRASIRCGPCGGGDAGRGNGRRRGTPRARRRGWRWRSCCMLLRVDEAEEDVLQVEADEAVLGQGQVVVGGEAGHLALNAADILGPDPDVVRALLAIAVPRRDG